MTDRPILFSAPMVNALLAGTKTQTRRVFKVPHNNPLGQWEPSTIGGPGVKTRDGQNFAERPCLWHTRTGDCLLLPYEIGDRLWVREHWLTWGIFDDLAPSRLAGKEGVSYIADGHKGLHMPRWASRLTLTVTDVRIERLQAISEADARAEGIQRAPYGNWKCYGETPKPFRGAAPTVLAHGIGVVSADPAHSFATLWDSINAKRGFGWAANPWVTAITFTVHRQNIDQLPEASTP